MRIGSLFSGIGGFELGLESAIPGAHTVWQCEIDPYARQVLAKHWPDVPCFEDITTLEEVPPVDLICGGFPCQDISSAGKGAGINGTRSGLFFELMRVVRMARPQWVCLENVAAITFRGLGTILGELARCGYDAEWRVFGADTVGAPHIRKRIWIIGQAKEHVAHPYIERERQPEGVQPKSGRRFSGSGGAEIRGIRRQNPARAGFWGGSASNLAHPKRLGLEGFNHTRAAAATTLSGTGDRRWEIEPPVCGVVDGVPHRVDRIRALGNAIVPACAYQVGLRVAELARAGGRLDI
jgi:DNA (cytosine-5)-methyltransferase 1